MSAISVCIPTYNRPDHFEEALQSVSNQDPAPYEILVGDDSTDRRTERLVQGYVEEGVSICHLWNEPSLGLAKNVDKLFEKADGDYIILLHDDDRLVEGALSKMWECFKGHTGIVASFGKQHVISADGQINWEMTNGLNENYHRTSAEAGRISSTLLSATIQQFPNDGFMVKSSVAKEVGYDLPDAGETGDYAFGVELARTTEGNFYFTDEYTAQYRLSEESLSGGSDSSYRAFKIATEKVPDEVRTHPLVQEWLRNRSPVAVMRAAQHGFVRDGFSWYFGPHHRHRIPTLGGIRRLLVLIGASLGLKG